jgi:hypothetical protein
MMLALCWTINSEDFPNDPASSFSASEITTCSDKNTDYFHSFELYKIVGKGCVQPYKDPKWFDPSPDPTQSGIHAPGLPFFYLNCTPKVLNHQITL